MQRIIELEAVLKVSNEYNDHIIRAESESVLKEISDGIRKYANGLLDQRIEAVKFGPINTETTESHNYLKNEFPKYLVAKGLGIHQLLEKGLSIDETP